MSKLLILNPAVPLNPALVWFVARRSIQLSYGRSGLGSDELGSDFPPVYYRAALERGLKKRAKRAGHRTGLTDNRFQVVARRWDGEQLRSDGDQPQGGAHFLDSGEGVGGAVNEQRRRAQLGKNAVRSC